MIDERQTAEETIVRFQTERWHLERKLAKKRKEYEKLETLSSELLSSSFWKKIFQRKFKRLIWEKEERLRKEILELEQKILKLEEQLTLFQEEKE